VRVVATLALACLVLAGATACGSKSETPLERAQKAAQKQGDEIKSRLEKGGFTVGGLAAAPNLTPAPQRAWRVEIDFTTPQSFTLTILVFRTDAQAKIWAASYAAQCKVIPQCKALGDAQRTKVVGNVVFAAESDDGKTAVSPSRMDEIIGIATGQSSGN
jgi:hypothetical protein